MKSVREDTPTSGPNDDHASGSSRGSTEVPSTPSSVASSTASSTEGLATRLGTFNIIEENQDDEVDYDMDDGKVTESLGKKGKEVDRGGETD